MAVRVAQRNESPVQFVDDARKIADIINDRMVHFADKLVKKYDKIKYIANRIFGYYYEMPIRLATDAYLRVTAANRIYIRSGEPLTVKWRAEEFDKAIECYNKLTSVISIIFNHFTKYFNANAISNILELINNEVEQIKKIKESDKLRLNCTGSSERS